jgi:predicted phage terminase large subunit-like protein
METGLKGLAGRIPSEADLNALIEAGTRQRTLEDCKHLSGFVRHAWHILEPSTRLVWGWSMDAVCDHLEAISSGKIIRLLINIPSGFSKSLLASVFWPAWEWTFRPHLRYLTGSFSETHTKRDCLKMRDLVLSPWYQSFWGEKVRLVRDTALKFENSATGSREGRPFHSMTGGRGDRIVVDDPHSVETAESETQREDAVRTFRESITSRLNDPKRSAIVVIMQRLHAQDISGEILRLGGYDHLMLPMEFEVERRCRTSIGFEDPRREDGELLFPERFPRDVVDRDKHRSGAFAFASQFQQRPAPRGGGLFQPKWFGDPVEREAVPANGVVVRRWDLAATEKAGSNDPSWTVGVRMRRTEDGRFWIEDVVRFRGSSAKVEEKLKEVALLDGQSVRIRIPQDPGQAGKGQSNYLIRQLAGFAIEARIESGSKETRAAPFAAQAEAGNVRLLRGHWNEAFLEELGEFPGGRHADQCDAAAGAFDMLAITSLGWSGIKKG